MVNRFLVIFLTVGRRMRTRLYKVNSDLRAESWDARGAVESRRERPGRPRKSEV
jgi:hypothetical protein